MLFSNVDIKKKNGNNQQKRQDVVGGRRSAIFYGIFRALIFLFVGIVSVVAGAMYFSESTRNSFSLRVGRALFITAASLRLIAELSRLFQDRVGLFCYGKYRENYISQYIEAFTYEEYGLANQFKRCATAINDMLLIVAASMDFGRSLIFLPSIAFTVGKAIHIASSAILILANLSIIYFLGLKSKDDPYNLIFKIKNILRRPAEFLSRVSLTLAALMFLIGSILYLPEYNKTSSDQIRVGGLYTAAGIFITITAIFLFISLCVDVFRLLANVTYSL